MRNLKIILEYDGTAYHGWQRQINGISVQQVLEEKIAIITGEEIRVTGSGRTDTGVHALGQVAHFKTKATLAADSFLRAINSVLPRDISVKALYEVDELFHARNDAKSKIYLYQILNGPVRPVLLRNYVWFVPGELNLEHMRKAALYFQGTHDFSSFCSTHSDARDRVRTILQIRMLEDSGLIKIEMEADGFLRYMVRGIVGTLVEIGKNKRPLSELQAVIAAKDRRLGGMTAPPQGLFLKEVRY